MSKKYLDTKSGSLEEKISQIAKEQPTIKKPETNVKLEAKTYFGVKEGSLAAVAAKVVEETEYQTKFKKELEKTGKSVAQMSDAEKKAFFNKMDTMHKAKNETHTWTKNVIYKKQKETGGEKEVIKPIKEGGMKDIATNKSELERLTKRLSDLRSQKSATSDKEQKAKLAKDILQTQKSVADVRLSMKEDAGDTPSGGIYALRAIKAKRERLQGELENLDKKDPNYQQKADNLKKQIETQREIMRNKQRAVFTSYDPSLKNEAVKEPYAVGMAQAMKQTGDKPPLEKSTITKAHDIAKSIMQKEEEVSQKAINKFHTRLDKLVHKAFGHSSDEKQVKKENDEVPKGYHKMPDGKIMKNSEHKKESKSFKEVRQKMNAQKDTEKDLPAKGKTMTGQPLAKIDTEPKTKII